MRDRVALEGELTWVSDIPDIPELKSVTVLRVSACRITPLFSGETDERLDRTRSILWEKPMGTGIRGAWEEEYPPTVKREKRHENRGFNIDQQ